MYKIFTLVILISILFPSVIFANEDNVKAGFIRDGDLWILNGTKKKQITTTGNVMTELDWSHDGKWLLYQRKTKSEHQPSNDQVEVWAYHMETGEKKRVFYNGYSPSWAPDENVIAFNNEGILNISDLDKFYNMATGVDSYTWLPDGSGFLLSSAGTLRPDGWSSSILYKKKINEPYQDMILFGGVNHFFTLPKEIGLNNQNIIAVNTSHFNFSPSNKWISFIVSPTASWSMDSNMLCVIASDGSNFEVLDEVIFGVGKPKWAPSTDTIAYIAGGGRIVFGFKNKDLKIKEMPISGSLTPPDYVDIDFDWITDKSIVTSRMEEREWSNDFNEHPLPSLYSINIDSKKQVKLTNPPESYGDYRPKYVKSIEKIVWLRGTSITDQDRTLWKANPDGTEAKEWIKNVDAIEFY